MVFDCILTCVFSGNNGATSQTNPPIANYTARQFDNFAYMYITALSDLLLEIQATDSLDGTVIDTVHIVLTPAETGKEPESAPGSGLVVGLAVGCGLILAGAGYALHLRSGSVNSKISLKESLLQSQT